jgi:hypothetical protein
LAANDKGLTPVVEILPAIIKPELRPPTPAKTEREPDLRISKRRLKRMESIELVRAAREQERQSVGFSSRPFVLCGLPIQRPKGTLIHIRKNGKFFLRVAGDPEFGLPFGQDRLIPLWVATLAVKRRSQVVCFDSAAEILDAFGLPKDGKTYRRLVEGCKRIFASTMFFGTEEQLQKSAVWDWSRFHFFDRMRLWYTRKLDQTVLPDEGFKNVIALSDAFWQELQDHPIPVDLAVVKGLADSSGALDFYLWVCWRCWTAKGTESIPLFGSGGLVNQLGVRGYAERWKFRQTLRRWLALTLELWPDCPAFLSKDGSQLTIRHGQAISS